MKTRKILAVALSLALFAIPVVNALDVALFQNGDVNMDNEVTATDLTALARHVGGIEQLPETADISDKVLASSEVIDGKLVLTYEDGTTFVAATMPERKPTDGFGFELLDNNTYAVYVEEEELAYQDEIVIPDTYDSKPVTTILGWGMAVCEMSSVTIPDSITTIEEFAFYFCENLTEVTIPKSVTAIGQGAFDACTDLQYLTYEGTVQEWVNIDGGWNVLQEVRCTNGTVAAHTNLPDDDINLAVDGTPVDMNTGLAPTDSKYFPYYDSGWSTCDSAFDANYTMGWQLAGDDSEGKEPTGNEDPDVWYEAGDGLMHKKMAYSDGDVWIGVLFEEAVTVNCVGLYWEEGSMPADYGEGGYYLQYTEDGVNWLDLTDLYMDSVTEEGIRLDAAVFENMDVKGLRAVVLKGTTKYAPKLQEFEIYCIEG